jgi:Chain length determinant protein
MNDSVDDSASVGIKALNDEIKLKDVFDAIWRFRIGVLACLILGACAGVTLSLVSDEKYEATIVLSTVSDEGLSSRLGGLGALASQYGGIASLAGISIGGNNKRDESLAVLQSEFLTEKYINDHNLLPVLFPKYWDASSGKWTVSDKKRMPTLWKANRFFNKRIRKVTDEKRTGLVYLKIEWKDPVVAALWANDLVKLTNAYLRDKAIQESENSIAYLREQGAKADSVDARHAIYTVMENEINKEMLARERQEFALKILDPAVPPERPSSFGPVGMGVFGLAAGLIVSMFWVAIRTKFRPRAEKQSFRK